MKRCCYCKKEKDGTFFYSSGTNKDGLRSECISCAKSHASIWAKNNRKRINDRLRKPPRDLKTRDELLASKRQQENARYLAEGERIRARIAAWKKANPHRVAATNALRKALVRRAVPAWADLRKMESVYLASIALTRATGIPHHVDHIVPIVHPLVCGLHTHDNLQVLTASENCSKQNRWSPDDIALADRYAYLGRAQQAMEA